MDETHYARIEQLRNDLDETEARAEQIRRQLQAAIYDAFPETHGHAPKRGILAEVSRRSKYSRETVAQIRDGKIETA
jgi:hypothetical protein